jgi:hypothetical protein
MIEAIRDRAIFLLASGQTLKVLGVKLYPADELAEINRLRAHGLQKLGGVSSGIGVIGSPGWAIGAGVAIGLLEGLVSNSVKTEGAKMLAEAERLAETTQGNGVVFEVAKISGVDQPYPNAWVARTVKSIPLYIGSMSRRDRAQALADHGKVEAEVDHGNITIQKELPYLHNGDDFLACETEFGLMNVRWSGVVGLVGPSTR